MERAKREYQKVMAKETRKATKDRVATEREINKRKVAVTNVYDRNVESPKTVLLNDGSAGSSKSWSIAQIYIEMLINGNGREMLVTRKTLPALKLSAYKLVINLLKDYGYYDFCNHNKSDLVISYREVKDGKVIKENNMYFKSLDDVRKMKSAEFTNIWCEEATENSLNDFHLLRMRLRAKPKDKIYPLNMHLSFNPIDQNHWIATSLLYSKEAELIKSSYKDNPFLDRGYVDYLKSLKEINYNLYRVYCLGEWGVLENVIYDNWTEISSELFDSIKADDEFYGLDFGVVHATVLEHIKMSERKPYIREEIYKCKKSVSDRVFTNADLIDLMEVLIAPRDRHKPIYADSAEPNRIEEISRHGFNIHPADKDVLAGIDLCLRYHLYICGVNTVKEIRGYCRMVDKNGNVLAHPVKVMDNCMDGIRYGMYTHLKQYDDMQGKTGIMDKIKRADTPINSSEALGDQYNV